jgi:DNA (cytosine-5)-methyltransferase 1
VNFNWNTKCLYSITDIFSKNWPDMDPFLEDSIVKCPNNIIEPLTVEYWFKKNDVVNHLNGKDFFTPKAGITKMQSIQEGDVRKKCYKRLHRWRYSPTAAYGNNEVHLHPYKIRRLSVAETLAIQSLPKEFCLPPEMTLTDKFKTVGNGVPYLAAKGIAESIKAYLEEL